MIIIFRGGFPALADRDEDRIGSGNMPKPDSTNVEANPLG
jgi:hypothetical protein